MASHDEPGKIESELLAIQKGAPQVLAGGKTLTFGGKTYDLVSFLQAVDGLLAPYSNANQFKVMFEKAVADRRADEPTAARFVSLLKLAAAAVFGEDSLEFALFGFEPKKKPVTLTPEQKQHKLEQMRATRLARHTMGKRQKKAVKGDVSSKADDAGKPAKPTEGPTP